MNQAFVVLIHSLILLALSPPASQWTHGAPLTPGNARIDLSVRKPQYLLGENVLVDFCVVNQGAIPFTASFGGDYRGATRSLRFKLQVRDSTGRTMEDPDTSGFCMGGLSADQKVLPGKEWCKSLPLARYARIEGPGTYTITATHDLGWPEGAAPSGTCVVSFAMPTAAQAARVVAAMGRLPKDPDGMWGQKLKDFADFSTLRYQVYVAPLLARAAIGHIDAIDGLTEIPTTSATRALLHLLDARDKRVARAAARGLATRLPDPQLAGQLGPRGVFEFTFPQRRRYLSRAWDPALANEVRAAGRKRLRSTNVDDRIVGAFMIEAVGTAADGPALVAALDAAIADTSTMTVAPHTYPPMRGAMTELLRAADMLVMRGLPAPTPRSDGDLALWLVALKRGARPAGWETGLLVAFKHPTPYLRQLALDYAPDTIGPALVGAVGADLAHPDQDVRCAAARLAARARLVSLKGDVVAAMANASGLRLNEIGDAAYTLGARYERVQALVARLADAKAFDDALRELVGLLENSGFSTGELATDAQRGPVISAWQRFAPEHRAEIEAGRRIPLSAPGVTPDLVPPTWKLHRADGQGDWP